MATKSQVKAFSTTVKTSSLSTIQKFILLLDKRYLDEFKEHLHELDARKSLQLVEAIEASGFEGTPDSLCETIYGSCDGTARHTFNQLASATFRFSHLIARNYPNYLYPNTEKILHLVNDGKVDEANVLAKMLSDVAEKICDYQTQLFCHKFFTQQAYLNKDHLGALKQHDQLLHVIKLEETYQLLNRHFRSKLNPSLIKNFEAKEIDEAIDELKNYFDHESPSISLYAKYAYLTSVYYLRPIQFETPAIYDKMLPEVITQFHNHSYLVFPLFSDLQMFLSFYRINSPSFNLDIKKNSEEFEKWKANFRTIKFWKYYLNQPEIYAISVKSNYYVIKLSHYAHRKNQKGYMTPAEKRDMDELITKCEEFINDEKLKEQYEKYLINLHPVYASLVILHPDKSYRDGVTFLERTLISYQQTSLNIMIDNIFSWLIIGYFCMKDYGMCAETFARYQKITKGRVTYEYNDIIIHFYYYLSKWLMSRREQFVQKLQLTFARAPEGQHAEILRDALRSLATDFQVPGILDQVTASEKN